MHKAALVVGLVIGSAANMPVVICASAQQNPAPARKASALRIPVPYALGKMNFLPGDQVTILGVSGDMDHFAVGGTFRIWGRYALVSQPSAFLALWSTDGEISGAPSNRKQIKKGHGKFDFTVRIVKNGQTHVSFYPSQGGQSFGGVYFGSVP